MLSSHFVPPVSIELTPGRSVGLAPPRFSVAHLFRSERCGRGHVKTCPGIDWDRLMALHPTPHLMG